MISKILICFFLLIGVYFALSSQIRSPNNEETIYKPKQSIFNNSIFCPNKDAYFYDYPNGDMFEIYHLIETSQINFIFLYADWDARSIHYGDLFLKLVCDFHNEITFYSINCFYGQCKAHFNLIKYPQILINIKNIGSFAYKNPFDHKYMTQYLKKILRPLRRIDTIEEFFDYLNTQNAVLIGNFNFTNQNETKSYKNFYKSSMDFLASNDEYSIGYGIILNKTLLNQIQKIASSNHCEIMLFTKLGFQNSLSSIRYIKPENLTRWVKDNLVSTHQSDRWFHPDINKMSNEKSKLLVFIDRESLNGYWVNEEFYSIINFFVVKASQACRSLKENKVFLDRYLDYLEFHTIKKQSKNSNPFLSFTENQDYASNSICQFQENTEILFIDKKLYKNYAVNLLGYDFENSKLPKAILINVKNQTIYQIKNDLNFLNIHKFMNDPEIFFKKRLIRTKQIANKKRTQLENFVEINSKQLKDVINNHEFKNKDVLVFYFNNHCGFCRMVNFKLINLAYKFFKNCKTLVILKIDTDLNDMDWELLSNRVPTLIFMPMSLLSYRETILYDFQNDMSEKKLLKFIIKNSRNPGTFLYLISLVKKTNLENMVENRIESIKSNLNKMKKSYEYLNQSIAYNTFDEIFNQNFKKVCLYQINLLKNII
ncbi:thioredoxin domain-containing 11 [Brachionus plicatilis]|uniref:Thioredoxin domain-containing 11 n=1 Tax=Brachionus plicatilis TaxID=10195 RepID=A0A3M7TAX1_BRAPC|nr:thioredoxin domain-containing 11 [Brachionus plicatilis]